MIILNLAKRIATAANHFPRNDSMIILVSSRGKKNNYE